MSDESIEHIDMESISNEWENFFANYGKTLDTLGNFSRPYQRRKRLGRGVGSHLGKRCGRGQKGAGSRSGYKMRLGKEGGQQPLYRKMPCKGFSNAAFKVSFVPLNFEVIERLFNDGEIVCHETLFEKGFISGGSVPLVKVLAKGTLTKKVEIYLDAFSESAKAALTAMNIPFATLDDQCAAAEAGTN
jgi:large subunit ribosomal protein L15